MSVVQNAFMYNGTSIESLIGDCAQFLSKIREESDDESPSLVEAKSVVEKNSADALTSLIKKYAKEFSFLFTTGAKDKEIESYFTVLLALFKLLGEKRIKLDEDCIKLLVQSLADDKPNQVRGNLKLKLISIVYNVLSSDHAFRYEIFLSIIRIAANHKIIRVLVSQIQYLPEYLIQWNSSISQSRNLYSTLSSSLKAGGLKKEAYGVLLHLLKTFEQDASQSEPRIKEAVTEAIVFALNDEDVLDLNELLQLKVVQLFKSEEIVQLLRIFVTDNLTDLKKFTKSHQSFFQKCGLKSNILLQKMSLLTLATLAIPYTVSNSPVPYDVIADALEISESEAEVFVITALKRSIISGKINQIQKAVHITRTTHRQLKSEDIAPLPSRLESWKSNLTEITQVISRTKGGQLSHPAAA